MLYQETPKGISSSEPSSVRKQSPCQRCQTPARTRTAILRCIIDGHLPLRIWSSAAWNLGVKNYFLQAAMRMTGKDCRVLSPLGFPLDPLPDLSGIPPRPDDAQGGRAEIDAFAPDCLHIATEGPLG